jgi:hypothetical protein
MGRTPWPIHGNELENIMGNRAVISFSEAKTATGIYLHWNGGPESILAFLDAAKKLGEAIHSITEE